MNMVLLSTAFVLGISVLVSPAQAAERGVLIAACKERLGVSDKVCACMTDKAASDLNADQYALFSAMIRNDTAEAARLRGRMSADGVSFVGTQTSNINAECTGNGRSN